jgi:hypothetical protein
MLRTAAVALSLAQVSAPSRAYYLIVKWGAGSPIAIRYESRQSCERAADAVIDQSDSKNKPTLPLIFVEGANMPWAFCIPA